MGSFRDPEGSVFFHDEDVYRSFPDTSFQKIDSLVNSDFFKKWMQNGDVIETSIIDNTIAKHDKVGKYLLRHKKIPFIIYPYEWSFYMLKDAALLTLSILKECLKHNFILKDGTAWNITFHNGKMCFFDILSIESYKNGQTWDGYAQFCQEFLYPLLIQAYKGIDFHVFMKGSLKGVEPKIAVQFFGFRDWFRPGIFKHVILNAKLAGSTKIAHAKLKNKIHLPKEALVHIVKNLETIIENLHPNYKNSIWFNYTQKNTYAESDSHQKREFILGALNEFAALDTVIDFGCNTGDYSILASEQCNVISCDIDSACIDKLYLHIKSQSHNRHNISPLVLDLMNPSAQCGWRLRERRSIHDRLPRQGSAFLALALIHHICIASNVPLENFIEFIATVAPQGVLEWVDKSDPMVQFLLQNRKDVFDNYSWENFEKILSEHFKIAKIVEINGGTRKMCLLKALV